MSKKNLFPIAYLCYIACIFLFGQIKVPYLSINWNILSTVVLFVICLKKEGRLYNDKFLGVYWVYLAFYGLSALYTGYFSYFFHFLYSSVLMAYVLYWSTIIVLKCFDVKFRLPLVLLTIGVFASVITIFQALGKPIENSFVDAVTTNSQLEDLIYDDYNMGISISGIYRSSVINGRYLLFFFLISFFLFNQRYNILYIALSVIILIGLFFCQQRSAFYLSLLSLAVVIINYFRNNKRSRFLLIGIVTIVIVVFVPTIVSFVETSGSRLMETSGTGRERIFPMAIEFILSNPIFAGDRLFFETCHSRPHNIFLSAFISGGLFGGIVLSVFVVKLISRSLRCIINRSTDFYLKVAALVLVSLIGDSMFHNFGFVQADLPMFISLAIFNHFYERNFVINYYR